MTQGPAIAAPAEGDGPLARIPAPLLVLVSVFSIQIGAALAVGLFASLGPLGTVFCRVALSALIFLILIRPRLTSTVRANARLLLTYGVALGTMNWCFYEAIARIPLGIAVTIEFFGPLGVAVVSSRRWIDLLWIAIALLGLLLLAPAIGSDLDKTGVLYAVLAGIGWGGFIVLSQRVSKVLPGSTGLAFGMIIAALCLAPFAIPGIGPVFSNAGVLLGVIGVAILATAIPFFFEFAALRRLSAQTYGVLVTIEPAAAALAGAVILGETLGLGSWIAVVCVMVAAGGATLTQRAPTSND